VGGGGGVAAMWTPFSGKLEQKIFK